MLGPTVASAKPEFFIVIADMGESDYQEPSESFSGQWIGAILTRLIFSLDGTSAFMNDAFSHCKLPLVAG